MSGIALDPIRYNNALQKTGLTKAKDDVIEQTQWKALEEMARQKELATKADLEIGLAKAREEMQKLHNSTLIWMFGMFVVFAGALIALLKS